MSSGGTVGFQGNGGERALELPSGENAVVAPSGRARLRYNQTGMTLELSVDGAAYVAIGTGGGVSPWVEGGGVVRLQNAANTVAIGAATMAGTEKLRVIGDIRVESEVQVSNLTSVPGSAAALGISSDNGQVTVDVFGTAADAFVVRDTTSSLISTDLSGLSRSVLIGVAAQSVDLARLYTARTQVQVGADAAALQVEDGVNDLFVVDTIADDVTVGSSGARLSAIFEVPDSVTDAIDVRTSTGTALGVDTNSGTVLTGSITRPMSVLSIVPDAVVDAFAVRASTNDYIAVDTSNGIESITLGNAVTNPDIVIPGSGEVELGGPACLGEQAADPAAAANFGKLYTKDVAANSELFYRDSSGNVVQMTNGGAVVATPGGANTQVQYNSAGALAGSANFTFDGTNVTAANALFANGGVDRSAAAALALGGTNANAVNIGNAVANPPTTFLGTGDVRLSSQVRLTERVGDPVSVLNNGFLYTKDVAAVTELFYEDSAGNVVQVTSGGGVVAGAAGANTQVQYNSAGALAGSASFTFDGTNVTTANALFANGGLDRSAAASLAIGASNATSVVVGTAVNPIIMTVNVPDNTAPAVLFQDDAGLDYFGINTTNFGEAIFFGNNTNSPDVFFSGTGVTMAFGTNVSGTIEAANFGPSSFSGFSRVITVGAAVECTGITIGQSANVTSVDSSELNISAGPLTMDEIALDPGATLNVGKVYTKDVTAVTELFYQDSAGNVVQITSGGAVNATATPAGANTQVQFNNAGAFGASADLTFNDTTDELTIGAAGTGTLDLTAINATSGGGGHAINIGTLTPSTTVTIGRTGQDVTMPGGVNVGSASGAPDGELRTSGSVIVSGNIDKGVAASLSIGATTSTNVRLARAGVTTTVTGTLQVDQAATFSANFFIDGSGVTTIQLPDNTNQAFQLREGVSNHYIRVDTTNLSETLYLGPPTGITEAFVRLRGGTAGGTLDMEERSTDPGGVANRGRLYAKDVSGVSLLFFQDSAGTVTQITSATASTPVSVPIADNTALAYEIFEGGAGDDYLLINTTNLSEAITLGNPTTDPDVTINSAGAINLGITGTTIGVFGVTAAGQAAAYTVTNPATRRSFDTTTVTVDQLAEVVGTIIADMESWGWFA